MLDWVEMIKDDLVMMGVRSTWFYKKRSNVVDIHHCTILSELQNCYRESCCVT